MKLDLDGKSAPEKIRLIRIHRGLNQEQAAGVLDIAPATLSNFETGARTPSLEVAVRIERVFGIPASSWISTQSGAA